MRGQPGPIRLLVLGTCYLLEHLTHCHMCMCAVCLFGCMCTYEWCPQTVTAAASHTMGFVAAAHRQWHICLHNHVCLHKHVSLRKPQYCAWPSIATRTHIRKDCSMNKLYALNVQPSSRIQKHQPNDKCRALYQAQRS